MRPVWPAKHASASSCQLKANANLKHAQCTNQMMNLRRNVEAIVHDGSGCCAAQAALHTVESTAGRIVRLAQTEAMHETDCSSSVYRGRAMCE